MVVGVGVGFGYFGVVGIVVDGGGGVGVGLCEGSIVGGVGVGGTCEDGDDGGDGDSLGRAGGIEDDIVVDDDDGDDDEDDDDGDGDGDDDDDDDDADDDDDNDGASDGGVDGIGHSFSPTYLIRYSNSCAASVDDAFLCFLSP